MEFKEVLKQFYSPKPAKPELVTIPKFQFAMIDGHGDPNNSKDFQDAIGALYSVVYSIKFGRKKAGITPDFKIAPLEGLWWNKSGKSLGSATSKTGYGRL
jgi:hypothetical protein